MKKLINATNKYLKMKIYQELRQLARGFIDNHKQLLLLVILAVCAFPTTLSAQLCASSGDDQSYEWMNRFQLNGVSTPTYGVGGYFDYSASSMTTLNAGTAYPMQADVYTDGTTYDEYVIVWLDMNQDGVIDDATERVYTNNANVTTFLMFTGDISAIPTSAHNGDMIGRVIMQYSAAPVLCGTYTYGTTIDFKVTITGATTYFPLTISKSGDGTGDVTSVPSGTSFLPGTEVTLTATATGGGIFTGWSGDTSGTTNPLIITMDAAKNITATFMTQSAPILSTTAISSIGLTSASSGGNVTSDGNATVTARGVCWNTTGSPTISDSKTSDGSGTGSFTSSITGLSLGTDYYVRAYATNSVGTGYGSEVPFTTLKNPQTITFNALSAKTYGNGDFDPGATASSGLTVTYSSSNTAIVTIVSNQVHIVSAGTVTIYADQTGNGTYYAAPQVPQSLTVNAKVLTVTGATAANKVYDGNLTATISGGSLVGVVGADAVTLATATSGTFAAAIAGTGISVTSAMTLTGVAAGNYSITQPTLIADITAKELTVTDAIAADKVYDGTTDAVISGATLSGVVGSDDVVLATETAGTFASANVGTAIEVTPAMTITGTDIDNYSLTQPTLTAGITAKELTVTGAKAENKMYDGTADAVISGATLEGVVGSDDVTLATETTGTFASANIGTAIVVIPAMTITGMAIGNYILRQPTLVADIAAKELTVTGAVAANKTYDGTTDAVISGATLVGVIGLDDVTLENTTAGTFASAGSGTNIGVNTAMTLAGTDIGNYVLTQPALTADIIGLTLTVTDAVAANKVYDGTTDAVISGATLSGVVGSDDVILATETIGTFASANVGTGISITTFMTLTGADANKYMLTQPALTADIIAKTLTVTGANANKVYDGTDAASITGATLVGVVGSDVVNIATPTGTFASVNVGTGISVTPSLTITGAAAGNYILTQPTLTADITARPLEITATAGQTKAVGDADPVFAYTITSGSMVTGEALSGALDRTAGETAGNYPILTGTLSAGDNYSISFVPADFVITPVTGMESPAFGEVVIYPNPTNGMFTVEANEGQIRILNLEGKVVVETLMNNKNTIDISNQPAGAYILFLTTKDWIYQYKIIKK
jgi:hypothetical protein